MTDQEVADYIKSSGKAVFEFARKEVEREIKLTALFVKVLEEAKAYSVKPWWIFWR